MDLIQDTANNSPVLAADPTDGRFVVLANRVDAPRFGCRLHVSGDRGRAWTPVEPVPSLPPGTERCYGPEVAFDRRGVLHFLFVGLKGRGNRPVGAFLVTSSNRGRSFSRPRRVLGPNVYQARMAINPQTGRHGRLHLVWLAPGDEPTLGGFPATPNPILASYSDDGGRHFSRPVQVSDPGRRRAVAPALDVSADGTVNVAYYDLNDDAVDYQGLEGPTWEGTWSLVVSSSRDGGRHFPPGVVVDDTVVPPERVMLIFTMAPPALASGRGRIHAAWPDARNGDWDVLARSSSDGGRSWGPVVRLNDDPPGNGRHQYLPRLALAPTGRLDAVFLDRRNDPENVRNDVFFTSSTDGGASFSPNLRLSTESSSSAVGARYLVPSAAGKVEYGGRLALLSDAWGAVAAWPDTRHSLPGEQQDVVATEVVLASGRHPPAPEPDGSPALPVMAVAAPLAAAAAGAVLALRRRRARSRPRRATAEVPAGPARDTP